MDLADVLKSRFVQEKLIVTYSGDGINGWICTIQPADPVVSRDMSLYKDGTGTWWMVSTYGPSSGFYLRSSLDTKAWTTPVIVPMPVATAVAWWAPEWFVDSDASVHVFVAVSLVDDQHFQIYETHPTASDMSTWSAAQPVVVTGVSNLIDPFVSLHAGTYTLWFKGCSTDACPIEYATSSSLAGPYGTVVTMSGTLSPGIFGEGPSEFWINSTTRRLYFDRFNFSGDAGQLCYTESTDNWTTWSTLVPLPTGFQAKHGTPHIFP